MNKLGLSSIEWGMYPVQGGFGIKGNDIPLCSMGGLNKAKSVNETLVIKKWWGNTYLALMSSRITGMKLTRENT